MQEDVHVFQGMKRDIHPIKQEKQFLWEAHNIRLTTRDGDSMLSITNEKSTEHIFDFGKDESYIGHSVVGNYLIVFVKVGNSNEDIIYRINLTGMQETPVAPYSKIILYKGDLGLSHDNPIQAISDYEHPLVQKVYWIDGINNPRVINVAKPELLKAMYDDNKGYTDVYSDSPFSFVQDLDLNENITITRAPNGNGMFHSGTIQYAFTYYHKYGQESNIFHTSELLYISHNDRGGSPEDDSISTAFEIQIDNIQTSFQYLRIYSIIRTSRDSVPTVKRVTDIELTDNTSVSFLDDGTTGDTIDPTQLLYIGGKDIIAGCICAKDNVLFLGNIEYKRIDVDSVNLTEEDRNSIPVSQGIREELFEKNDNSSFYNYFNQLSKNTSTFKSGEVYRLGFQLQYKNGEWSEPVFIDDREMTLRPYVNNNTLGLPKFSAYINDLVNLVNTTEDYKKIRPLVVLPFITDRNIIAQGMICPTVFNAGDRDKNTPFAQSSWFLRPFSTTSPEVEPSDATLGHVAEFRHYNPLLSGMSRGAEIQNMYITHLSSEELNDSSTGSVGNVGELIDRSLLSTKNNLYPIEDKNRETASKALYYVDQSVLTFHSPDIEFDEALQASFEDRKTRVQLVGVVPFISNFGDIDIITSTATASPDASGFINQRISNTETGANSLIAGLFYEDGIIDDWDESPMYRLEKWAQNVGWMVYPWHRSASLNNDTARPDGEGERTSVLMKKVISNIKTSNDNLWLKEVKKLQTSNISLFRSNEVSLVKILDTYNKNEDLLYYGNVDTLNTSYSRFRFVLAALKSGYTTPYSGNVHGGIKFTYEGTSIEKVVDSKYRIPVTTTGGAPGARGSVIGKIEKEYALGFNYNGEETFIQLQGSQVSLTLEGGFFVEPGSNDLQYRCSGYILTPENISIRVDGYTTCVVKYKSSREDDATTSYSFNSALTDNPNANTIDTLGDQSNAKALLLGKEGIRIKYKSTPHLVFANDYNEDGYRSPLPIIEGTPVSEIPKEALYWLKNTPVNNITTVSYTPEDLGIERCPSSYLWLAEITQEVNDEKRFGGKTVEALRANLWIPAGPAVSLNEETVEWIWGDTWYQRYDCLKTYPFTNEDVNQMVEIGSFMCETRVNIDGRYDRNRGLTSNLNMSPINFNLVNPVYTQSNNFFNYRIMDKDYYKVNRYPSQLMWSLAKSPAGAQDEWTNLHMANTLDLDGTNGPLTAIASCNDLLIGFQEKAVQHIMFNSRVQIQASDGVPIEIANSGRVDGTRIISDTIGCQDKFSVLSTPEGIYFIDNNQQQIYLFTGEGKIQNLGLQLGQLYWSRDNHSDMTWRYKTDKVGNNGIRIYYDSKFNDVYFTPGTDKTSVREALCFSERLANFTSLMSYGGAVMFSHDSRFYSIANNADGIMALWENFPSGSNKYNNIFGNQVSYSFSFISNERPENGLAPTKIFDTVEMRTDKYEDKVLTGDVYSTKTQTGQPFNYIRVDNEYQDTGQVFFNNSTLRKKFRIWRALIPRNKNTRERIRNPWAKITLGYNEPGNELTILHDISVKYTI